MNNVFIGNLANADGNDVLEFDGVNDSVNCGNSNDFDFGADDFIIECDVVYRGDGYIASKYSTNDNKRSWGVQFGTNQLRMFLSSDGVSGISYDCPNLATVLGTRYRIKVVKSGAVMQWYIDDVFKGELLGVVSSLYSTDNNVMIGCRTSTSGGVETSFAACGLNCLEIYKDSIQVAHYVKNGDFGSATLTDHSGNGNTGTINGATWAKDKYNQSFATKELYKAQWPIPMEESQAVTFELKADYVAQDDVYWNPYNQDGVYTFTVGVLQSGTRFQKYNLTYSYNWG